jgi:hypothetical protein
MINQVTGSVRCCVRGKSFGIRSADAAKRRQGFVGEHARQSGAELLAQGAANIASPLFGGLPATRRALDERTAAMRAVHPNARKAHLEMASRYDELAQSIDAREKFLGLHLDHSTAA